ATNAGSAKVLLGKTAQIGCQTVQSVIFRVDRPDNFVQRPGDFTGSAVDLINVGGRLLLSLNFTADRLAKHGDAREAGPQVIVDVASNAGPFALESALTFRLLK